MKVDLINMQLQNKFFFTQIPTKKRTNQNKSFDEVLREAIRKQEDSK